MVEDRVRRIERERERTKTRKRKKRNVEERESKGRKDRGSDLMGGREEVRERKQVTRRERKQLVRRDSKRGRDSEGGG